MSLFALLLYSALALYSADAYAPVLFCCGGVC